MHMLIQFSYSMGENNNSPLGDTKKAVFLHSKIDYFKCHGLADSVSYLMHLEMTNSRVKM